MHIFDCKDIFLVLKNMTKGNLTACLHFIHFQSDSREKINSYFVKLINVDMLGKKVTYTFAKLTRKKNLNPADSNKGFNSQVFRCWQFFLKKRETNDIVWFKASNFKDWPYNRFLNDCGCFVHIRYILP